MNFRRTPGLLALSTGLLALPCPAQWSSDPGSNFLLADGPGEQTQPKVAPTPDGGAYISWFDSIGTGFDVRVQRVDAGGMEALAHNGVLVADRGFTSTQDYGLDVDSSGNALLTFRDDSGTGTQISVAKVSPGGLLLYGATQLTSTTAFVGAPVVAGTSDGGAVIAWQENADVRLQKVDAAGSALWGAGVTLSSGSGFYSPADLHDTGTDVILSFVHQTGGFGSPRNLYAQKLDASGALLWGAGHVPVFDSGSLQVGNFPDFEADGEGGAVFSWYDAGSSSLQCYVQRVDSSGTEVFPHNGVAVSTDVTQLRVDPWASFDSSTGEVFVAWTELNAGQSERGVRAQKLDATGQRQWTDSGAEVLPLGADAVGMVHAFASGGRTLVFWASEPSFGMARLFGARLDATGTIDVPTFDVSSTPSGKARLGVARSSAGFAVLAWVDARNDDGDVYLQNVSPEGGLADGSVGTPYCFCATDAPCGNVDSDGGCAGSNGLGARALGSGSASVTDDDLVLEVTDVPVNQNGLLFMGPSMIRLPFGDGLQCVGSGGTGSFRFPVQNSGASGQLLLGPGIAAFSQGSFPVQGQIQAGQTWNFQGWFRDPSGPCGTAFNTSNAVSVTFAP